MALIQIVKGPTSGPTSRILASLITEQGITVINPADVSFGKQPTHRVSYGASLANTGLPQLNNNSGRLNKLAELQALRNAGVPIPPFFVPREMPTKFPLLARKLHHRGGKDIVPVFTAKELDWRTQAGYGFFTEYVPWQDEYRVWVFRNKHLATYRKDLAHPEEYTRIGCNHKNGFRFKVVPSQQVLLQPIYEAIRSIKALELDFAAIDILHGEDNKFYVLEVNTAPGVEGEKRQGIQGLAKEIVSWAQESA